MNKEFAFSKHAIERCKTRNIYEKEVYSAIRYPDSVINESDCKRIFHKLIEENNTTVLLRVFVNTCKEPNLIITAYKTSKKDKYEY